MRLQDLKEARIDSTDVSYELAGQTKAKTAAGEFSKITATVSGSTSAKFTKLASKFKEIDIMAKELKELRDATNDKTKRYVEDLFDAEDAILTRYVNTVSLSITMSKAVAEKKVSVTKIDIDGFVNDLLVLVGEELAPEVQSILAKHTKVTQKTQVADPGKLKIKTEEASGNGIWEKVKRFSQRVKNQTMQFLGMYDQKLNAIASKYGL